MPYVTQNRRVGLREPIDAIKTNNRDLTHVIAALAMVDADVVDENIKKACEELARRSDDGQDITGDINFCICRAILGHTKIHVEPRYSKIHLINRAMSIAQVIVTHDQSLARHGEDVVDRAFAVIEDAKLELYSRYAVDYEAKKREENGDIMEDRL